eukprot:TRINITY_DN7556_c1_g2_i2.p1 TRINITY_DN7556_c1_g2~~TRINITY_DN7556_c1_g2_i2.p1  ORF type:complete len:317 (-),score=82.44 TRINITY_DN7556_c1_g2_i2:92-1042(-)
MEELRASAEQALSSAKFEEAISKFSQVLEQQPDDVEALLGRSQAYLLDEDYLAALSDSKKVLEQDPLNAKANYRKGVACYEMDELETAMSALEIGLQNVGGEVTLAKKMEKLLEQCKNASQKENEGDMEQSQNVQDNQQNQDPQPPPPPAPKYRHQHYQTPQAMNIDIFAKKLTQERLKINFSEKQVSVTINSLEGEPEFELNLDLYSEIVPEESKYEILRTKVEICMRKKDADLQWPTLEKSEKIASNNFAKEQGGAASGYPSSAKTKKNWENLDKEGKEMEENEKPEGDAAVQALFQKIYKNADEDTRRAMMKS